MERSDQLDDQLLVRLQFDLVRRLRRHVRCASTAQDIAADVVMRAFRRFFFDL